jgi:hypothetical protein
MNAFMISISLLEMWLSYMHTILFCNIVLAIAVSVIGHRHSRICSRWLVNLTILYVIIETFGLSVS